MTQLSLVMHHERRIAHLLASQRKLKHLVDVDTLTKLPNRRHFHELAERAVETARDAATLIVFDVDRLKRVNELLGHANGDEALRQIGTALRETLRRRDVAGRIGGDEFAAVLPRTRLADSDDRRLAHRRPARRPRRSRLASRSIALNVGSGPDACQRDRRRRAAPRRGRAGGGAQRGSRATTRCRCRASPSPTPTRRSR